VAGTYPRPCFPGGFRQRRSRAGRRLVEAGKLTEARSILDRSPENDVNIAHVRGLLFLKLHDYPKAIESLRYVATNAAAGTAVVKQALVILGQSYFLSAKMTDAVAVLEQAVAAGRS
jgi:hypothetical protein